MNLMMYAVKTRYFVYIEDDWEYLSLQPLRQLVAESLCILKAEERKVRHTLYTTINYIPHATIYAVYCYVRCILLYMHILFCMPYAIMCYV